MLSPTSPCVGLPLQYWNNPGPLVSCELRPTIQLLLSADTSSYSSRTRTSWPFLGSPSWNNLCCLLYVRNGNHHAVSYFVYLAIVGLSCLTNLSSSAAAETRNPRKNLVIAMRTVFFRIFICYVSRVIFVFRILKLV